MTVPQHHATDDLLLAYVTGSLPYPMEVAIAAHLTLCPTCRDVAEDFEAVGGEVFADLEQPGTPSADIDTGLQNVLSRLDEPAPDTTPPPIAADADWAQLTPAPVRALAGQTADLAWRPKLPGVAVVDLSSIEQHGAKARLVRTVAGGALPKHLHRGLELTLILAGGLTDQHGHFRRGDLLVIEQGISHRPVMDEDEDCLCLGVTDGPVILTGIIGRMRQVLSGY